MNVKPLAVGTLRAVLGLLYRLVRLYFGLVVTYGPIGTAIALVFTFAGAGWGQAAGLLGIATALHFVLLQFLDSGYAKLAAALQRRQFA